MASSRAAALVAAVAASAALRAAADDLPKVQVAVGERVELCGTIVLCPASGVFCDDPSVVRPEETAKGVAVRGLAVGTTVCAAQGANLARRPFRVVVTEPPKKKP